MSKKKQEAAAIRKDVWEGLQKHYATEIDEIHRLQAKDMQLFGYIQSSTEAKLDALMERVVRENKERQGSKLEFN